MADKSTVGHEFPSITWVVEKGKIKELVQAIGDGNPVYVDKGKAIGEGYKDTPVSLTFSTVPMCWENGLFAALKVCKIKLARALHGEESYEYFQEMYPGDVLTGKMKVVAVDEKSGKSGSMDLVRLETVFTNQRNEMVLKASSLIVERK